MATQDKTAFIKKIEKRLKKVIEFRNSCKTTRNRPLLTPNNKKPPSILNARRFQRTVVPEERLELSRILLQRLLRPQRLPISPSGHK